MATYGSGLGKFDPKSGRNIHYLNDPTLGTAMGTLGYVAPEQITNVNVDHRTDIFSLGAVLCELLTNRLPFSGENEMVLIHSIFNMVPAPPSSIRQDIPKGMDSFIGCCLAKDPYGRLSSVSELLEKFLREIDGQ